MSTCRDRARRRRCRLSIDLLLSSKIDFFRKLETIVAVQQQKQKLRQQQQQCSKSDTYNQLQMQYCRQRRRGREITFIIPRPYEEYYYEEPPRPCPIDLEEEEEEEANQPSTFASNEESGFGTHSYDITGNDWEFRRLENSLLIRLIYDTDKIFPFYSGDWLWHEYLLCYQVSEQEQV